MGAGQILGNDFAWVLEERNAKPAEKGISDDRSQEAIGLQFCTMNLTTAKELINRFKEKYPFIKPEIMRAGGGILLNRILAETKARRYAWDVVLGRGEIYLPLRERKLLIPYRSPELGAFPDDLKDNEGYWTSVYVNPNILGYNTELVAKKDVPTTYQDLLTPRPGRFCPGYPSAGAGRKPWPTSRDSLPRSPL
jgi:ABC-type glycerol-3-phosphate transport system substrate-binding protein